MLNNVIGRFRNIHKLRCPTEAFCSKKRAAEDIFGRFCKIVVFQLGLERFAETYLAGDRNLIGRDAAFEEIGQFLNVL